VSGFKFKSFTEGDAPGLGLAPDRETELRLRMEFEKRQETERALQRGKRNAKQEAQENSDKAASIFHSTPSGNGHTDGSGKETP